MAIEFHCPECNALIRVPDNASGKKGSCPSCSVKLRVPTVEVPDQPAAPVVTPPPPAVAAPEPVAAPDPTPDPNIPPPPEFMAPRQPAAPPLQPPAPPIQPPAGPVIPQDPAAPTFPPPPGAETPAASPFPGPPGAGTPGAPGAPLFPGPDSGGVIPPVAPGQSIARKAQRLARRKKGGMWFPLLCGLALAGGLAWMYLNLGPDIDGERIGYAQSGTMMQPRIVPASMIVVDPAVRSAVLSHFQEDSETLRSQFVEARFSATSEGLEIQILTGSETQFVRFPIDADLREWYNANFDELEKPRTKNLTQSLKDFVTDWDVAIRNNSGVEDPLKYRDDVGLTACVGGLGYHVQAQVANTTYRCVFEDDGNLYFLLPLKRERFKVTGRRVSKKAPIVFPGEYDVAIRPDPKNPKPAAPQEPAE